MSETLGLEMAPLGVRVVTVQLGGVETAQNDPNNRKDLELPANSYYEKIAPAINRHQKGLVFAKKDNVDVTAKNIVRDVLDRRRPLIRHGNGSWLCWFGNTFMTHNLFTKMVNAESGLEGLGGK